jgi:glyoxylase-like metal-dependent hydrolase (beta-lactamase superfamily II)
MEEKHFGQVTFIQGENKGRYPFCHSLFIEGPGIIIDPASDRRRLLNLRNEFSVNEVWLSHWHEDHIMHLDLFDHLPLRIHEADAPPLSDLDLFIESYGEVDTEEKEFWRKTLKEQFHFTPRKPSHFFRDGEIFYFEQLTVEMIAAPGHTPGHLAMFFREPQILFLADYDLTRFGPWYGDKNSSIEDTIQSINKLREIPAKTWLTCHGSGVFESDPGLLWDQYLGVIDQREKKLLDLLKKPKTFHDIVNAWIIYGRPREPESFFKFGERLHMAKHLEKLTKEGQIERQGENYLRVD